MHVEYNESRRAGFMYVTLFRTGFMIGGDSKFLFNQPLSITTLHGGKAKAAKVFRHQIEDGSKHPYKRQSIIGRGTS
jgi:hypothetical protein